MTKIAYQFNIGIDVSKQKLDVSYNDKEIAVFDNSTKGFKQLVKSIKNKKSTRIVIEATGGYERPLAHFLQDQNISMSIVNAKRVRDFAKVLGRLAKTDEIDSQVIRLFTQTINPHVMEPRSESQQSLDSLVHRRDQLVKQRAMEKQHLETVVDKDAKRFHVQQ